MSQKSPSQRVKTSYGEHEIAERDVDDEFFLGQCEMKVVGIQHYDGITTKGELVHLVREPRNPYDRNAVAVINTRGQQVGHISRDGAAALASVLDDKDNHVNVDAVIASNKSKYSMQARVSVFTTDDPSERDYSKVMETLRRRGINLNSGTSSADYGARLDMNLPSVRGILRMPKMDIVAVLKDATKAADAILGDSAGDIDEFPHEIPQPSLVSTKLMEYQLMGLHFMAIREAQKRVTHPYATPGLWKKGKGKGQTTYQNVLTLNKVSGDEPFDTCRCGILADDMGLGKTIQAISIIALDREEGWSPDNIMANALSKPKSSKSKRQKLSSKKANTSMSHDVIDITGDDVNTRRRKPAKKMSLSNMLQTDAIDVDAINSADAIGHAQPVTGTMKQETHDVSIVGQDSWDEDDDFIEERINASDGSESTLILCPASLISVWEEQIRTHAPSLSICIYHGSNRKMVMKDVVITSFTTLATEYEPPKQQGDIDNGGRKPPFRATWHRVIADEAHYLRNYKSRMSRAARALTAERRWALSGTIIYNTVRDLHSIFAFVGAEPLSEPSIWKRCVHRPLKNGDANGIAAVKMVLRGICLRRTKESKIDGKSIVQLPQRRMFIRSIELNEEERGFYNGLYKNVRAFIIEQSENDSLGGNFSHVLSFIQHLRTCVSSTALVEASAKVAKKYEKQFIQVTKRLNDAIKAVRGDVEDGDIASNENSTTPSLPISEVMLLLEALRSRLGVDAKPGDDDVNAAEENAKEKAGEAEECPVCFEPVSMESAVLTVCKHLFCRECFGSLLKSRHSSQRLVDCPLCRTKLDEKSIIDAASAAQKIEDAKAAKVEGGMETEEEEEDEVEREPEEELKMARAAKTALMKVMARERTIAKREARVLNCTSSKTDGIIACIAEKLRENSKIAVFSQWKSYLDVLETQYQSKIKNAPHFARLDGTMNRKERQEQLKKFNDAQCKVMFISLLSGGVGLTLTMANVAILAEPAWTRTAEDQGADRIYRIGQTRDVEVIRFIMKGTIEEKIVELQEKKARIAKEAMSGVRGEAAAASAMSVNVEDVSDLFDITLSGLNDN